MGLKPDWKFLFQKIRQSQKIRQVPGRALHSLAFTKLPGAAINRIRQINILTHKTADWKTGFS